MSDPLDTAAGTARGGDWSFHPVLTVTLGVRVLAHCVSGFLKLDAAVFIAAEIWGTGSHFIRTPFR